MAYKWSLAGGIVGGSVTVYYVATHLERTPITNRLRFVAVTGQQILEIAEVEEKLAILTPNISNVFSTV